MVGLDAVVEDGDDDALAREAPPPRGHHVHVAAVGRPVVEEPLLLE